MNIHLIPDETLDEELYTRVLSLLQAVPGVNNFYATGRGRLIISEAIKKEQEIPDKDFFEKQRFHYPTMNMNSEVSMESRRTWWIYTYR